MSTTFVTWFSDPPRLIINYTRHYLLQ